MLCLEQTRRRRKRNDLKVFSKSICNGEKKCSWSIRIFILFQDVFVLTNLSPKSNTVRNVFHGPVTSENV